MKPSAKVEQRQGFDDRLQHTKPKLVMKLELFIKGQMECELTTNELTRDPCGIIAKKIEKFGKF